MGDERDLSVEGTNELVKVDGIREPLAKNVWSDEIRAGLSGPG